jgi:hypothetical protein
MKPLLLLLALPLAAHASWFTYEAGAGLTSFETEDGRWYQQRMDHSLTTIAPEYSIGITGPVVTRGAWGVDWHLDYVNLGRASASCQCDTSDSDYAAHNTRHTALFTGSGRALGVSLTVEPYRWYGGLRYGLEAGAYVYRSSWSEQVYGWSVGGPPQDLSLSASRWNAAPVIGVSVGDGAWSVNYRHYFMRMNSAKQNVPPLWNDADVIEIKRRF